MYKYVCNVSPYIFSYLQSYMIHRHQSEVYTGFILLAYSLNFLILFLTCLLSLSACPALIWKNTVEIVLERYVMVCK